jgi:hypothetical protein
LSRKRQIIGRRFLRFLHEGMQRNQHALVKSKQDARFTLATKRRSHLPKTAAQRPTHRQTDRPSELHLGDVPTNGTLILARQFIRRVGRSRLIAPFEALRMNWRNKAIAPYVLAWISRIAAELALEFRTFEIECIKYDTCAQAHYWVAVSYPFRQAIRFGQRVGRNRFIAPSEALRMNWRNQAIAPYVLLPLLASFTEQDF